MMFALGLRSMKNTLAALASTMIAIAFDSSFAYPQQVEVAVVKKLERWVYCPANLLNAVDDYYLVNGSLRQSWSGLGKEVVVVIWDFEKRVSSLSFFADRGHQQIIAGYYDAGPDQIKRWLDSIRENNIPGVIGVMYTTWQGNYTDLKAFSNAVAQYEQESARKIR